MGSDEVNSPEEISHEEYLNDPNDPTIYLSRSVLNDMLSKTPRHAWINHPKLNPDFKPDHGDGKFDLGSAAHDVLLEGGDKLQPFDGIDDWRTKAAQASRHECWESGKVPLLRRQYDQVMEMVEAALAQIKGCKELGIKDFRAEGDTELTYKWKSDDINWKIRLDWISKDRKLIADYKTSRVSADPAMFAKSAINFAYDIQDPLYCKGVNACEGTDPKFIFMIQEVIKPYLMSFVALSPMFIELGESKILKGGQLWKECLESGKWPAWPTRVAWVDPAPWAVAAWEYQVEAMNL